MSIFTGPIVEIGGGMRTYNYYTTINTGFSIMIENRRNDANGGTVEPAFYQTGLLDFNVSWIDLQMPLITTGVICQSPHTGTLTVVSTATGR